MLVISNIKLLPGSPYEGTDRLGLVITSGVPCYYMVTGSNLDLIKSVNWYPANPSSVLFTQREFIQADANTGTFMFTVIDNFFDITDRAGNIVITSKLGNSISYPVTTFGPVSAGPLWTAPNQGLITG